MSGQVKFLKPGNPVPPQADPDGPGAAFSRWILSLNTDRERDDMRGLDLDRVHEAGDALADAFAQLVAVFAFPCATVPGRWRNDCEQPCCDSDE